VAALAAVPALLLWGAGVVLAADAVPTVEVTGTIVGTDGQPVEIELARLLEYETATSEPIVTPIIVAADGTFTVVLRAWGTPEEPARAVIEAYGVRAGPFTEGECQVWRTPFGTLELSIPGQVPAEPIEITVDRDVEDAICGGGLTATPPRTLTLPPTDLSPRGRHPSTSSAAMLAALFVGASAVALLGLRRRRR
jgi:hypothetical protein